MLEVLTVENNIPTPFSESSLFIVEAMQTIFAVVLISIACEICHRLDLIGIVLLPRPQAYKLLLLLSYKRKTCVSFFSLKTLLGEDGLMSPNATIAAESAKVRREAEAN